MIRLRKQQMAPQLAELSLPVVERLRLHLVHASVVLAYYPLSDEVDIRQLINDLVASGKTVLLPKVVNETTLELRRYTSDSDLCEGAFHIMEPVGERYVDYQRIDVALIPGMAFDAQGHRLGRGRGFYDRLLSTSHFHTIGVCFDFQKVSEVPYDDYDCPVDMVA